MTSALDFGVGYSHMPQPGQLAELHAIDPATGRSLCGHALAIAWSPEDSAGTAVDCPACITAMNQLTASS